MNDYLKQLHQKILEHQLRVEGNYPQGMQCKNGCSQCCYVSLSVFNVEAQLIKDWFTALKESEKEVLREKWLTPAQVKENFFGEPKESCPFLVNESCSIYEVRPIICRTQGLPLKFVLEEEVAVDACPLNFEDAELELGDCLDLDKLNLILSSLQIKDGIEERISLKKLKEQLSRNKKGEDF